MTSKILTKVEWQLMQVLWRLEKAFIKEILFELPEPKPAYNSVSTIIRILEKKGAIGYEPHGNTHQYYPLIDKSDYLKFATEDFLLNHFSNSMSKMFKFYLTKNILDSNDVYNLQTILSNNIKMTNSI